jgi:hypothetical protein
MTDKVDNAQFRQLIAAIIAAGCAAGQDGGCSPPTVYKYYQEALKIIQDRGLQAS